jgi:hypothetical protein
MHHNALHLACILALCAALPATAQTPLKQTTSRSAQTLLGPGALTITDNSSKDGGESIVQTNAVQLDTFSAATGVLVGVTGRMAVDSATTLIASRPNSGGNYTGVGWVRAEWALQPGITAFSGLNGLARIAVDGDNLSGATDAWNPIQYSGAAVALGGFVSQAPGGLLASSITTHLVAAKVKAGGGENRVVASTSSLLSGAFSLEYSFLQHASAGFDAAGATSLQVKLPAGGADLQLLALGDASHTTRLDLLGVQCVQGDCDAGVLGWSLQDLAAGQGAAFRIGAGSRSATYALLLGDDTAVGAAASHRQQTLTLTVSAVPEPGTWALLLAGVALLGVRARRMQLQG